MASPFKFFRKYSSGMMIVMVILSMLLFTLDSLFSDTSANLWLLGLLLGGGVFAIAGAGQGRWLQWGIGGAVLGTALGFILPGFVEDGGLSTSLGVIDEEGIYDLEMRRSIANQFVVQATEKSFGEGTGRFATLFGFGHQSNREDVIFGKLMRAEADRLGIAVNQDMINDYLKRITSDKLTTKDYVKIRNGFSYDRKSMNDDTMFSILGDEIKARMAYQILRPRTTSLPPGPEVYWEYFRRLNVRQQLNTVALDVDQFVDQVGEPSPADVEALFAQYRTKAPNQDGPGTPGFRLPFRAKVAYLELDYASMEASVGEVSDAAIEAYYEENKETPLIRTPVLPDEPEEEMPEKEVPSETPETKEPGDPASDDAKPEPKTDSETPAEPKTEEKAADKKEEAKPEPAAEPAKPEPAKEETPADVKKQEAPEAAPAESDAPAEDTTEDAEPDGSCGPFETDEESAADEAPDTQAPATDDKAADAATSAATETQKADDEPADKPQPEPAAGKKTDKKADDKTGDAQPSLTIPSVPAAPGDPHTPPPTPEIQYEYRELDDELKTEIRGEILRQRVREAIEEKMTAAVAQMETLARERSSHRFSYIEKDPAKFEGRADEQQEALKELREQMRPFDEDLSNQLKAYAKENGFAYVETPLIGYSDFLDEEDFPISSATQPDDNPMMATQTPNVAYTLFNMFSNDEQNNDAQVFFVRRAKRRLLDLSGGESHYAYWAIDFSVSHVPDIDEAGVRDSVVLAWKRIKARDLVMKRGEELAQIVRDGLAKEGEEKQDMTAVLKDKTVTGTDDGAALAVRTTLPFSWLRTSSASPMSFQRQQATLSPVQFADSTGGALEMAGDDFMMSVFNDLKDEEVGVVANADLSKYYVTHVTNRFPTPEVGEDGLRDRFGTEGQQFAFAQSPMIGVMQQQLDGPASLAWEKKVWLRYGIDPDGEPDEE